MMWSSVNYSSLTCSFLIFCFRCAVASLLTVALHSNLSYLTEVMEVLLKDLMQKSSNAQPKLLLRRTESIVEKLLTNWMSICLYGFLRVCCSQCFMSLLFCLNWKFSFWLIMFFNALIVLLLSISVYYVWACCCISCCCLNTPRYYCSCYYGCATATDPNLHANDKHLVIKTQQASFGKAALRIGDPWLTPGLADPRDHFERGWQTEEISTSGASSYL